MLKAHEHDQNCLQTDLTIPNNIIQVQNFHENQITREPEFQLHERKAFLTIPIMSDQAVKPGGLLEQELEVLLPFVFSSCDKCANRKCTCHNMCILLTYMHKMPQFRTKYVHIYVQNAHKVFATGVSDKYHTVSAFNITYRP